jgi:hypothetical protein
MWGIARLVSLIHIRRRRADRHCDRPRAARGESQQRDRRRARQRGRLVVEPIHGIFSLEAKGDGRRELGLAAVVYGLVGGFIARLLGG